MRIFQGIEVFVRSIKIKKYHGGRTSVVQFKFLWLLVLAHDLFINRLTRRNHGIDVFVMVYVGVDESGFSG